MYKFLILPYSEMPAAESFFTAAEARYCGTLKIEKRRRDYALGRYVLKKLIRAEFVDADFENIEILKSADGYPVLLIDGEKSSLNISISHSNGYGAACASEKFKVGIDIEKIGERSRAWAEMCFTKAELSAGEGAKYLTELWAKKEAVVKVLNTGLNSGFHEIEFVKDKINFYGKLKNAGGIKVDLRAGPEGFVTAAAFQTGGVL